MRKSLEEMCRLVTGYGAWHIGDIQVSDGPHGVRAQEDGAKNNDSYEATCFPTVCIFSPALFVLYIVIIFHISCSYSGHNRYCKQK